MKKWLKMLIFHTVVAKITSTELLKIAFFQYTNLTYTNLALVTDLLYKGYITSA